MIRTLTKSLLVPAALLAAVGVNAQSTASYVATPAAAPSKTTLVTRDTAWNLQDGAYVTVNAPMREMAACQLVARSAGQLSSFTANGTAFDATQLDACNAKAKVAKTAVAKTTGAATPAN